MCYSPWGCKESDTPERLNWTEDFQHDVGWVVRGAILVLLTSWRVRVQVLTIKKDDCRVLWMPFIKLKDSIHLVPNFLEVFFFRNYFSKCFFQSHLFLFSFQVSSDTNIRSCVIVLQVPVVLLNFWSIFFCCSDWVISIQFIDSFLCSSSLLFLNNKSLISLIDKFFTS